MTKRAPRSSLRASVLTWFCLAAIVVASSAIGLKAMQPPKMFFGDGLDYLAAAYHLRHDGTFSQAGTDGPAPPALGREPGYGAVLAVLMAVDPGVGAYRPSCQAADPACEPGRYRAIALLNLFLIETTGVLVFLLGRRLAGHARAGLAAAAYLLLDVMLMRFHWYDPMSDQLALALVAAAMLAVASAWNRTGLAAWAIVGLAMSCATLVKAAFLPFCIGSAAVAGVALLRRPDRRRDRLTALATAAAVYAAVTGAWIVRNYEVSGMVRLTDNRGGIALSTREVFDHMTPAQFAAAFVFWTPDFGERLARRLFAPETTERFELYTPGGFYDVGQNGYGRKVEALMRSDHLDAASAAAAVDRRIFGDIAAAPFGYALSTLPLLYRGLWIDQFGPIGLVLLVWAAWFALRSRNGLLLGIVAFGLYNELFYALVSLNIPRYQMTALPAVAVAAGLAVDAAVARFGRRVPQAAAEGGDRDRDRGLPQMVPHPSPEDVSAAREAGVAARGRAEASTFARFGAVGAVGFAIDAGMLLLCVAAFHIPPIPARMVSFAVAVATTYGLNQRWTFEETGTSGRSLTRPFLTYLAVQGFGFGVNFSIYTACILGLPAPWNAPIIALALGSAVALASNYGGARWLVFGPARRGIVSTREIDMALETGLGEPDIVAVAAAHAAVMWGRVRFADLPAFQREARAAVAATLASRGIAADGATLTFSRGASDGTIEIAPGRLVESSFDSDGPVTCEAIPAGRAAHLRLAAPYEQLGKAWGILTASVAARGLRPAGPCWEVYADPSAPVTDLYMMLADEGRDGP